MLKAIRDNKSLDNKQLIVRTRKVNLFLTQANIAKFSIDQGTDIIDDFSGGSYDTGLLRVVGDAKIPFILAVNPLQRDIHTDKSPVEGFMINLSQRLRLCQDAGIYE